MAQLAGAGLIVACGGDEDAAPIDVGAAGGGSAGSPAAGGEGEGGASLAGGAAGRGEAGRGQPTGAGGGCASPGRTVLVRGSGFSEYEGLRVSGLHEATQNCPSHGDLTVIKGGSFSLSMTTPTGAGFASVFLDFNANNQDDFDEPGWHTLDGGVHEGDVWALTPADFEKVRRLRARATGLPAAYEGLSLSYALCAGPRLDPSCERGARGVRVERGAFEATFSYDTAAHHGLYLWLGDGDLELEPGEPSFRDTLPLPSRCAVESAATSCELEAVDFSPAP